MKEKKLRGILLFAIVALILPARCVNAAAPPGYQLVNAFGAITFTQPLCLSTPPGETNRIFVLEKTGLIQVLTNIGAATPGKSIYMDRSEERRVGKECR